MGTTFWTLTLGATAAATCMGWIWNWTFRNGKKNYTTLVISYVCWLVFFYFMWGLFKTTSWWWVVLVALPIVGLVYSIVKTMAKSSITVLVLGAVLMVIITPYSYPEIFPHRMSKGEQTESTVVENVGILGDFEHFTKSLLLAKEAQIGLENSAQEENKKGIEKAMRRYKQALDEAELIGVNNLNELVGGFGDMYEDNFTGGLRKVLQGYDDRDLDVFNTGQAFLHIWGEWYKDNYENIEIAINTSNKNSNILNSNNEK